MKIIIVEDEAIVAKQIEMLISTYTKERCEDITVQIYNRVIGFLKDYNFTADLVLFDIQMDVMNGMEAAKELRKKDNEVLIAFITSLSRYAIEGYSVSAIDYVLKPISQQQLFALIDRAKRILIKRESDSDELLLNSRGVKVKLRISSIFYIEVVHHLLKFYTCDGIYECWGSMCDFEQYLSKDKFSRCNVCYLVSLKYVTAIDGEFVCIGKDTRLKISRQKKKEFLAALANYLGMKNV